MKKIALALVLAAVSGVAMAEWVEVGESDSLSLYIDPATIRKDGNLRRVWVIHDLKQRDKDGVMSLRGLLEYDCKEARSRDLSSSTHSGPMAGGKMLDSYSSRGNWNYIPPGTTGEAVLKFVCAK